MKRSLVDLVRGGQILPDYASDVSVWGGDVDSALSWLTANFGVRVSEKRLSTAEIHGGRQFFFGPVGVLPTHIYPNGPVSYFAVRTQSQRGYVQTFRLLQDEGYTELDSSHNGNRRDEWFAVLSKNSGVTIHLAWYKNPVQDPGIKSGTGISMSAEEFDPQRVAV